MSFTAAVLLAALSSKTAGADTFAAGDACTATAPFKIAAKHKPAAVPKGATVNIGTVKGTLVTVTFGTQTGTLLLGELAKKCSKAPKGEVTLELGAGPIVKTEKQAEAAAVQAASQPAPGANEQVELTLHPAAQPRSSTHQSSTAAVPESTPCSPRSIAACRKSWRASNRSAHAQGHRSRKRSIARAKNAAPKTPAWGASAKSSKPTRCSSACSR